MTIIWLVAQVSAVVAAALLIARYGRLSAARRALALHTAFVGSLALSAGAWIPSVELPLLNLMSRIEPATDDGVRDPSLAVLVSEPAAADQTSARLSGIAPWSDGWGAGAVVVVWSAGVLVTVAPLAMAAVRTRRIRRTSSPADCAALGADELFAVQRDDRRVELRIADSVMVPMALGLRRPMIVLPTTAVTWPRDHVMQAVMHELEHIRRGDIASIRLARVAVGLHWFNPLMWLAWRRFRLEVEQACDDAVVANASAVNYAQQLVALARHCATRKLEGIMAMAAATDLTARVRAVLDPSRRRERLAPWTMVITSGICCLTMLAVAPLRVVVAQTSVEEGPPRPAPVTNAPHGNFRGVVYDPTGVPLGGLLVIVEQNCFGPHPKGTCGYGTWTRTDREGRFRFDGLPVGNFHVTSQIDFFPGARFDIVNGETLVKEMTMVISPVEAEFTICAQCAELVVPDSILREFEADRVASLDHPVSAPRPASGWEFYKPGKGLYPADLQEAGIEGAVVVQGQIGVDGTPTALKVEPAHTPLARATAAALAEDVWEPGRIRGVAVEVPFRFLIRYTLKP